MTSAYVTIPMVPVLDGDGAGPAFFHYSAVAVVRYNKTVDGSTIVLRVGNDTQYLFTSLAVDVVLDLVEAAAKSDVQQWN